jgi:hypothetical protein
MLALVFGPKLPVYTAAHVVLNVQAVVQALTKSKVKVSLAPNPGKVTDKQLAAFLDGLRGNQPAIDTVCTKSCLMLGSLRTRLGSDCHWAIK